MSGCARSDVLLRKMMCAVARDVFSLRENVMYSGVAGKFRGLRPAIIKWVRAKPARIRLPSGEAVTAQAVTDEGKRSLQMQPTADINQKGFPSSVLASLGHLPPREGLWPAIIKWVRAKPARNVLRSKTHHFLRSRKHHIPKEYIMRRRRASLGICLRQIPAFPSRKGALHERVFAGRKRLL